MQRRNLLAVIIISILTLGLGTLVYSILITYEINEENQSTKLLHPIVALLIGIVTFGIYWLYYIYKISDKLKNMEIKKFNVARTEPIIITLLMFVISPVAIWILQYQINSYLDTKEIVMNDEY